ncbi:hypothetical protein ACI3KS_03425 [Microbacterium sp. ZW T5_45]|uniref:hypothetical protein n=1 Tax=Microbacterium sp. ZW T5_45 TaxID=3378080 RepID=UPI0038544335
MRTHEICDVSPVFVKERAECAARRSGSDHEDAHRVSFRGAPPLGYDSDSVQARSRQGITASSSVSTRGSPDGLHFPGGEVLQQHLDDIDRRIEEMRRSREMTEHAMRCRAHDIASCPRFRVGVDDLLARF